MKEQFVSYELTLKLKELGFDEECFGYYDNWLNHGKEKITFRLGLCKGDIKVVPTPLWQQAFDWFREKHLLHSSIDFSGIKEKKEEDVEYFYYQINEQWSLGKDFYDYSYGFKHVKHESHFTTYEEARQACLEKLIEIVENENKQKDL